jgi:NADH-quinone oxidoreductase subunit J
VTGLEVPVFYGLALVALLSAFVVVGQRHPLTSAFALVVLMVALAGIYGLLDSPFIAVLQVIVYAGAIMVLFLFVLMLLGAKREEGPARSRVFVAGAAALGAVISVEIALVLVAAERVAAQLEDSLTKTKAMAERLFVPASGAHDYLYAFLATSILITSALVGAVWLSKKDLDREEP